MSRALWPTSGRRSRRRQRCVGRQRRGHPRPRRWEVPAQLPEPLPVATV